MSDTINSTQYDFDAIVVGSGISGGWAAKELTEKGLRVLVLDRGKPIRHSVDYVGEHAPSWKFPYQAKKPRELYAEEYPVQSRVTHSFNEATRHFWNNDKQNPYDDDPDKPFMWARADVVGGRSLIWGRQTYRFSSQDFKANASDGHGIPWPVDYEEMAPWYSHVEKFIGVNGRKEGLAQLPDGEFQKPMPWYALEETIGERLKKKAPDVTLTNSRVAILTEDLPGRSACHYCGPCPRGCSTGSYFSSQSSTLPAAKATGRLTVIANAVVERLIHDPATGKISDVQVIDTQTGERASYSARLFFLCASTIGSTQILMNSKSDAFPNGLANSSGALGKYMMDHALGTSSMGVFLDNMDSYYSGNRPTGLYIPRFRNLEGQDEDADFIRGYGYQTYTVRMDWSTSFNRKGFGADLKDSLRKPGQWLWVLSYFSECLPRESNRMFLSPNKVDRFGIPQVAFDFTWSDNEINMQADAGRQADRLMKAAGAVLTLPGGTDMSIPGEGIHEMGTARMGNDPAQAVLNKYNQAHDVPNLFVTDGSFMTSSSCVNPSLTYMAFTARAADYAARQLAEGLI
ncbi:GMC family oxidoreductase [Halioglobus sp. HI00S01]|uniref:GMC oxidoreductase n=1 Tax=Halioglobus sp. HI00S01 TaxID=1822214 RepID=UPI0007C35C83|nr:GMC family oxidoreductase [Halioglobus sp. HI00S01]KZX53458.1 GMC family oxidoreductase [Halioglobus sp. HI00S01]